eukprot:m.226969 g.226969  ORF g.226969 m.226969 type:complete len:183 (+) comp11511_c0_seq1:86-634(+)
MALAMAFHDDCDLCRGLGVPGSHAFTHDNSLWADCCSADDLIRILFAEPAAPTCPPSPESGLDSSFASAASVASRCPSPMYVNEELDFPDGSDFEPSCSSNASSPRPRTIKRPRGSRVYECDICGKRFSCSSNKTRHRRVHTGERPFECRTCNMNFVNSSNRNKHEKRCRGAKFTKRRAAEL